MRYIHVLIIEGENTMISRREFLKLSGASAGALVALRYKLFHVWAQSLPTLPAASIPKFVTPLLIPPVMPKAGTIKMRWQASRLLRDLDAAVPGQILPPATAQTVWGWLGERRGQ
jgi:hypothetical protein